MAAKDAAPETGAPKKSKKLLFIVVALILALVLAAAGVLLLLAKGGSEGEEEEEAQEEVVSKKGNSGAPPVFVEMESFVVNLVPEKTENGDIGPYMRATLSLEVDSPAEDAQLKAWMPRIRNDVTLIMSGKKESELRTKEGKEALAQEIRDGVNSVISPPRKGGKAPDGPVRAVLFTQFIIQ
jgi:flagellar FliL protein